MTRLRGTSLVLGLLLAGCATGNYIECGSATTAPLDLTCRIDGQPAEWVHVRSEKNDTLVDFNGHLYVFRGRTGHSGRLTFDEARLTIADLDVRLDRSSIRVRGQNVSINAEHLPDNRRRIIEGSSLTSE